MNVGEWVTKRAMTNHNGDFLKEAKKKDIEEGVKRI